jgi:peptide/nickel transport system permease protein
VRTYLLKRLLLLPVTLFGITLISFFIIHLAPGDPASLKRHGMSEGNKAAAESRRGSEDMIKKWRAQYDLDQPIHVQYVRWVGRLAHGDLGKTFFGDKDVLVEMKPYVFVSLKLEAAALFLIFAIAIPMGIYSAWRPGTFLDRASSLGLFVLYSLPAFWVATMLIIWFGNREHAPFGLWFPVSGLSDDRLVNPTLWERMLDVAHHVFLPVLCLSYGTLAVVSRYMRAGMLDVIRQDFIRTARAKGLPESRVILKHALRNALFPVVTLAASLLPAVVAGSIIVEVIFTIPGMGWYAIDAIQRREYNILMATFLLSGVMELIAILVADLTYAVLDPRVSFEKADA